VGGFWGDSSKQANRFRATDVPLILPMILQPDVPRELKKDPAARPKAVWQNICNIYRNISHLFSLTCS
jgi:hypothetical protein